MSTPPTGGRTTSGVVRTGNVVRRPQSANAPFVHDLLLFLEASGFAAAPRFLGIDAEGRELLTFVPGDVPSELGHFDPIPFTAAARILRDFHDVTARWVRRSDAEVVCHGDASPCNFVFRDGHPIALIDFDAARPGTRDEDVGYAAWLWLDLGNPELEPLDQGRRLATFVSAYGALAMDAALPAVLAAQLSLVSVAGTAEARLWAARCLAWTELNRARLLKGFSLDPPPT